ncbi:MAG: BCCT family transporter [Pseudomonadales bacterium]|jgi:choline/glycine/proline betaine transport protein
MISTPPTVVFGARHRLSAFAILSLAAFSVFAALDLDAAKRITIGMRDAVTGHFDWLFVAVVSGVLLLAIGLLFLPGASRRIGRDDELPEFSRWSWFAMLFSAGLASGLVYWGTAEPVTHFGGNPFVSADADGRLAATRAVTITVFHWGLHGWGLYAIAGLAIGLSAYRQGRPLTFSAALAPVIGDRLASGWVGHAVDLLALYGTVFGVATSIGLAVGSMNATIEPLGTVPFNLYSQLGMVLLVSTLGVLSVLSGVARGIRRLSEFNVWLSLALMAAIVVVGPTTWLMTQLPANVADYAVNALPMGFWIADDAAGHAWQSAWTVFYWGWWLAWTPFVALFIARISRGRTVREFILGVLIVPSLVVIVWMTIFGETAIYEDLTTQGVVSSAVSADYSLGLVVTIGNLPFPALHTLLLGVVAVLLFTWLITSLDSATLVICHILHLDHLGSMKILWGFLVGGVTCTLMLIGGIEALQAASIIIGLPMAILMLAMSAAAVKLIVGAAPQAAAE